MAYPQSGWPPPPPPHVHAADYAYGGPGPAAGAARAWPYAVAPPHGHGHAYAPYVPTPPQEPPKNDYWATELRENPLGLENMHIQSSTGTKESTSTSSTTARVPSSNSYSRASDFAQRNSYPPKSNTKASLAESGSHPNTRVPSPARPRHHERARDRDVAAPRARYASYPEMPGTAFNGTTDHVGATHRRPSSRAYGGRTSVPAEAGDRYSSASAAAAAQMAARSHTLPGAAAHRQRASAAASAQGMQRSKTLPGEVLAGGMSGERATAAPVPRRFSERYDYRKPVDDHDESEEEGEEEENPRLPHLAARPARFDEPSKEENKERGKMNRVKSWIDNARRALSSEGHREQDQMEEREDRVRSKSRSKSYRSAPAAEDDYGDHEEEQEAYAVPQESAARYAREQSMPVRHASAPDAMHVRGMGTSQTQNRDVGFTGFGESEIVEEPEDMQQRYQTQQRSRSYSQNQHQKYSPRRRSPYQKREQQHDEVDSSGSSSGSSASEDDADENEYHRLPLDRQRSGRRPVGTPHPARPRRLAERSDTLRVDDVAGVGPAAQMQVQAHLPSPRSLRHSTSSRTPSSHPSYEQVRTGREREREREREHEISKSPNGHLTTGKSSASAAAGVYGYGTPPITPTRQEVAHRADGVRSPYVPQPMSSASAAAAAMATSTAEPAPGFQTPVRLAYFYRGSTASPSPASHRPASTQPHAQAYTQQAQPQMYPQQTQAQTHQYGGHASVAEPMPKKRSSHASRSPSPLPIGQGQSSSSAYYAALGQARTPSRSQSRSHSSAHGHSHAHSHSYAVNQGVTQTPTHDARRRSSSRAAGGGGYSSASGAAAQAASGARHVRMGFWNRRGDHLTDTWHIVYCPPGRCYPRDLADYPDAAFQDHSGRVVKRSPDAFPELPESVPQSAGRAPEKGYDQFIKYVLVNG